MIITEQYLLEIRLRMESLITEREGMVALNRHRTACGHSIEYAEEEFLELQAKFDTLERKITSR